VRPEDNERLTRVGPGTPMGRLMREYWLPCLLSSELASPGCTPVRVMLLCERLIAFRDSQGRVGLLEEACPHRGASLFFAHNENSGLRCAYHGWKFDISGACLDTPTEPRDSPLKRSVRARAYPCVERGGIVWAYLGPRTAPPPLPELEPNLADSHGDVDATLVENNWLQALEGDVDIAHLPFVHADNLEAFGKMLGVKRPASIDGQFDNVPGNEPPGGSVPGSIPVAPEIEVADTPGGFAFAASVEAAHIGSTTRQTAGIWAVGHFMFPFYANLPYGVLGSYWVAARVPMDDYNTMTFGMWRRGVPKPDAEFMFGSSPSYLPNTADWFGRFRLARCQANDFKIDRERARTGGPGISGQAVQDSAITASMGAIVDRTREHLGKSDIAIIHLRRMLLAALDDFDEGKAPAVDNPAAYRVKQGTFRIQGNPSWHEELRRRGGAGVPPRPIS
jgi:phthalate 4,5-dioxygenase